MPSTSDPVLGSSPAAAHPAGEVDPRGLRLGAAITSVVLAVALVVSGLSYAVAAGLLAVQAIVFALGVTLGPARSPYGRVFATVVRPRLGAPQQLEDARPPRFAQAVGLAFTLVGLAGFVLGVGLLGIVATGFALVAALLNAAVGLCLGCEMYLTVRRFAPVSVSAEA